MKLISMTEFVLEQCNDENIAIASESTMRVIKKYANLLRQPLTLGMFVPCDENGNVLEEPKPQFGNWKVGVPIFDSEVEQKCIDFEQAKDRVLFTGNYPLQLMSNCIDNNRDVEWLLTGIVNFNFELTPTALKQIGL